MLMFRVDSKMDSKRACCSAASASLRRVAVTSRKIARTESGFLEQAYTRIAFSHHHSTALAHKGDFHVLPGKRAGHLASTVQRTDRHQVVNVLGTQLFAAIARA